jgi:hypothetical protein
MAPNCDTCKDVLKMYEDTQRTSGVFWKNCKSCRDKENSRRHKRRNAVALIQSEIPKRRKGLSLEKAQDEPVQKRECSICVDYFPLQDFVKLSSCHHPADFCHQCFVTWLIQEMETKSYEQIKCPSSGCGNKVSHDDVKKSAPPDIFTRY